MGLALTLKRLPKVLSTVLAQSDGLMAAGSLDVLLAKHVARLIKVLHVGLQCSVHVVDLLVDQSHL